MKKFIVLTVALVAMTASSAFALIASSKHDFTLAGWTNEICAPCHTPHNAIAGAGPLWSHTSTGQSFTMYSSTTMDNTIGLVPGNISLACLSCHDGVTAMDSFIGGPTPVPTVMGGTSANLTTDLTDDHPIGVTIVDGSDGAIELVANIIAAGLPLYGAGADMECATCHDVHNGPGFASLLRVSNVGSALCLDCHIK